MLTKCYCCCKNKNRRLANYNPYTVCKYYFYHICAVS